MHATEHVAWLFVAEQKHLVIKSKDTVQLVWIAAH